MTAPHPTIQIRIRDLRRERSLTQEELAEALGLSRQSINAMEAGRCLPSLPVALQIATFFQVPLTVLFTVPELEEAIQEMEEATRPAANHLTIYQPNRTRKEDAMTTIVPWSPLREMRAMLDEFMDETSFAPVASIAAPAVNVSQTADAVQVELRAPGFKKDDLEIEVGDDFITIKGEMKHEENQEEKQYFRREFVQQSFSRAISLPAPIQKEKAAAEMKNGVLHIHLPKVVEEKPKTSKLEIKANE